MATGTAATSSTIPATFARRGYADAAVGAAQGGAGIAFVAAVLLAPGGAKAIGVGVLGGLGIGAVLGCYSSLARGGQPHAAASSLLLAALLAVGTAAYAWTTTRWFAAPRAPMRWDTSMVETMWTGILTTAVAVPVVALAAAVSRGAVLRGPAWFAGLSPRMRDMLPVAAVVSLLLPGATLVRVLDRRSPGSQVFFTPGAPAPYAAHRIADAHVLGAATVARLGSSHAGLAAAVVAGDAEATLAILRGLAPARGLDLLAAVGADGRTVAELRAPAIEGIDTDTPAAPGSDWQAVPEVAFTLAGTDGAMVAWSRADDQMIFAVHTIGSPPAGALLAGVSSTRVQADAEVASMAAVTLYRPDRGIASEPRERLPARAPPRPSVARAGDVMLTITQWTPAASVSGLGMIGVAEPVPPRPSLGSDLLRIAGSLLAAVALVALLARLRRT